MNNLTFELKPYLDANMRVYMTSKAFEDIFKSDYYYDFTLVEHIKQTFIDFQFDYEAVEIKDGNICNFFDNAVKVLKDIDEFIKPSPVITQISTDPKQTRLINVLLVVEMEYIKNIIRRCSLKTAYHFITLEHCIYSIENHADWKTSSIWIDIKYWVKDNFWLFAQLSDLIGYENYS